MRRIGVAREGIDIMAPKAAGRVVHVTGLDARAANILKQEMLSLGGDVALPRSTYELRGKAAEALIMGTPRRLLRLAEKLEPQPFGLAGLAAELKACVESYEAARSSRTPLPEAIGGGPWQVMAIINLTPDSFYEGSRLDSPEAAMAAARAAVAAGAGSIDVGGESSRPGARPVEKKEELARVLPAVEAITAELKVPVSVDTAKAAVAREALKAGAAMINDITALAGDRQMARVVADAGCPVCLMHMQGTPRTMQKNPRYQDVVREIMAFFRERVAWAEARGIERKNIIIDPGIGFGKNLEHNLTIIRHLDSFLSLGLPVMIGASRKRFLGDILKAETEARLPGTVAVSVMAFQKGAQIFRVHDARENCEALKVAAAVEEVK